MAILLKEMVDNFIRAEDNWRITLLNQWPVIIGSLRSRVRIEKIDHDRLILGVYEVQWMQELFLLSRVILQSINSCLDKPRVTQLRFTLINTKSVKKTKKNESVIACAKAVMFTQDQRNALASIKDQELHAMLIGYFGRCQGSFHD